MKDLHSKEFSAASELSCGADVVSLVDNGLFAAVEKNERMGMGANSHNQPAGVMQEPMVPLEGFQCDVDGKTDRVQSVEGLCPGDHGVDVDGFPGRVSGRRTDDGASREAGFRQFT